MPGNGNTPQRGDRSAVHGIAAAAGTGDRTLPAADYPGPCRGNRPTDVTDMAVCRPWARKPGHGFRNVKQNYDGAETPTQNQGG